MYKDKIALPKIAINTVVMMAVPAIVYFLCMNVFVKHYIPIKYDVSNDINKNLGDLRPFFTRLSDISTKLLFDPKVGVIYYCYFPQLFILVAVIDAIAFRKYSKEAVTALYGIGMVYVGLAFIGYLLPLADLMHTTKRGLFKLFPMVMLYYRNSGVLLYISAKLTDWEEGKSDAPKTATKPLPKKPIPAKA
jgi:Na+/proline symporter